MYDNYVFYTILTIFFSAGFNSFNQHFKADTPVLLIYRGLGAAIVFSPLLFLFPPQTSPMFYLIAIIGGILNYNYDKSKLDLTSQYGAGPVSRLTKLSVLIAMLLWWLIDPNSLKPLLENKIKFFGVISSVLVILTAMFFLKKDKICMAIIKALIPYYIISTILIVLAKLKYEFSTNDTAAVIYAIIISWALMGITSLFILNNKHKLNKSLLPRLKNKNNIIASVIAVAFVSLAAYTKSFAMIYTSNPAYVETLLGCNALVIMLYNKIIGFKDDSNKTAGFFLIIGCIGLVYFGKN